MKNKIVVYIFYVLCALMTPLYCMEDVVELQNFDQQPTIVRNCTDLMKLSEAVVLNTYVEFLYTQTLLDLYPLYRARSEAQEFIRIAEDELAKAEKTGIYYVLLMASFLL